LKLTHREQRLKLVWVLALPFFLLARPTPSLLLSGCLLSSLGLLLRGWAAGSIHKDKALAVGGPYRFLRHPLYLGSFLLGVGLVTASGSWILLALLLAFFGWSYSRTLREERETLEETFGEEYRAYRTAVPALVPRIRPRADAAPLGQGFRWSLYLHNKEWEAALGTVAAFVILSFKLVAFPTP
jgi:protein-S-isoprenylcysteine O-methyltransferase Ste14